ncbi:autotransporter protein or domain, integral membrane beta-barrel [Hydrogenimonas sp.]|nr:autotransporter protein or domain, integral membrane beta-barrel [Hydrogenimonas sp.]
MKLFGIFAICITLLTSAVWGATLTDDFETSKNGWTDTGTSLVTYGDPVNSQVLRIDRERQWKSKTYELNSSNANKRVYIILDLWAVGGWESSGGAIDYIYISANGSPLVDGEVFPGADGSTEYLYNRYWFISTTDDNGDLTLEIMYDVSAPLDEKLLLDNITVTTEIVIDAADDSFTTTPDNPLTDNLLANDIGSNITVTSHTDPSNGTVEILSDGNFTYTPNAGFIGTDSFTYTITDDNNLSDTATVTIEVQTIFTSGVELPFYIVNPPASRNLVGDYKIAGNTVLCLTEKTEGYGGTCHGDTDYQDITSNMRVAKYLDIDTDGSTWNSTSSYVMIPDSYNASTGIIWAGLFWQGRISVDKDYPIHYAVENGSGYDFVEVGEGTTIDLDHFDITATGATDIKLDINGRGYNDVKANTFHVYTSGNGDTYSAYADVTSLFSGDAITPGKNTFTVANLTTMEGREISPGAFGGWSLVIIYAEDYKKGTPKNISIYNGFISIGLNNDPIEISGFRLPETGKISAQLSVFSGEGEYRYGRTPDNNSEDWMKISDAIDGEYQYMPGLEEGTFVGNRDNMFDARLDNILRDDIVNGVDNNLSINNVGVDVDNYDISELMEGYRDINPYINAVYIKMYSNNDYITPSMMAFSAELYKPAVCYDYTFDIDGYVLDSATNDVNTTLHLQAPGKPLRTHLLIRSLEGDFPLENAEFTASVKDKSMLTYKRDSVKIAPNNINEYEPAGDLVHYESDAGFSLYFGNDATSEHGGTLNSNESHYILFDYDTNDSQPRLETSFIFDVNFTVDYGSGPVTIYRELNEGSRCPTSTLYAPEWGVFNIISDPEQPGTYNLATQVSGRPFNVFGVFYDTDLETTKSIKTDIEVELINVNFFKSDTNASCYNPDSNISNPVFARFEDSAFTDAISHNILLAMRNSAFRIWYLEDNESTLVKNECGSRTDETCYKNLYDEKFASFDTLCKQECDGNQAPGTCYRCLRKNYGKPICSRDNFSIRPESYRITVYDDNNSLSATRSFVTENNSTLRVPLAADYNYSVDYIATRYGSDSAADRYVQGFAELFPAGPVQENSTNVGIVSSFPASLNCNNDDNRTYRLIFWNGSGSNRVTHNNVGDYRFVLRDSEWTRVDNPGRWGQDCIPFGNDGYTAVPQEGTVGCIISSNFDQNHTDINISFRPYSFDISGISVTAPNDSFIYMNDVREDYNMSIRFSGPVLARGRNGAILTNFSAQCYSQDIDLTFERAMNPAENTLSEPALLRYYDINSTETNTTDNKDIDTIAASRFKNGASFADLALNIDRNSSVRVEPMRIDIQEINVTCSNAASCVNFAELKNNHDPEGNLSVTFGRYIYYGRLHAPDYRTQESEFETPIYAEVYCDPIEVDCGSFGITALNGWRESVDDVNWWINPLHTGNDGNVTALEARIRFSIPDTTVMINDLSQNDPYEHIISNGRYSPKIAYTGESRPHKTRVIVTTEPWLRYHRFFTDGRVYYDVTFEGVAGQWAGIGVLGKTVETNASKSTNRRIEW